MNYFYIYVVGYIVTFFLLSVVLFEQDIVTEEYINYLVLGSIIWPATLILFLAFLCSEKK